VQIEKIKIKFFIASPDLRASSMHLTHLGLTKTLLTFKLKVESIITKSASKTTNNKDKNNQIWILKN